ncbi:trans-aconitate 2-methyltransferase [Curtobacterium sp. ISL-83]|uniref:class I SAM-dependent methyltransferase n=1 Tax=Curtobacterium sp. ISL-83 TaxID=2819145 RepID=UPI001BE84DDD|nr:class I SAM-dependent methyltransferase [Curtobacterium sp. ISL-83]MBT2503876.1 class I SAM-dependent methyltransferase [Curtobacterium sp. ISL-83]
MTDHDPRLVALYDQDNPDGPDHDFYRALADASGARSIVDLGCGTGLLTVTLVAPRRDVVGIDPSPTMLEYAMHRPGAAAVTWVLGDSRDIPSGSSDLAVMTGNVAQHIGYDDWVRTLRDLRKALRGGATLAFESRNPAAGAWRHWTSQEPTTRETVHGPLVEWSEAREVAPGVVRLVAHNSFTKLQEVVTETLTLHFRDRATLERDLHAAGFSVDAVYGDWVRGPVTESSAVLVVVATAR